MLLKLFFTVFFVKEDEPKKSDKQTAKKKGLIDAKKRKLKEKDEERETEDETEAAEKQSEHLKESKTHSAGGDGQSNSASDNQPSKDSVRTHISVESETHMSSVYPQNVSV